VGGGKISQGGGQGVTSHQKVVGRTSAMGTIRTRVVKMRIKRPQR